MRKIEPVSLETARELVDFGGGVMSEGLAEEQLEGAVSLHNILAKRGFAYLADEVGMGKTYVALGVVGLLRFFHPHLRILYITPRENIQLKWRKELHNFIRNNWKWTDQRVKSIQESPLVDVAICGNLADWARHAVAN
jgi:superfamily II DNA or RNA helicase